MARKAVVEGGKKEEIVTAALELFLSNGYDGTSIRGIMNRANGEVGLFYYYFKNKDAVFDSALDKFFARYNADFAELVAHGRRNPCRVMQDFFEYMEQETKKFREKYADKIHRTVRWAIREHTLTLIEPYLEQIVKLQSSYYGVAPALEPTVAALYLTHGVGSYILHEDWDDFLSHRTEVKRGTSLIMGMSTEEQELRTPYPATMEDIAGWMELVNNLGQDFLNLNTPEAVAEYETQLEEYIKKGEAWVFRYEGNIVAALLYSKERRALEFLAVAPKYRRRRLAAKLVETAAAQFPSGARLSVTIPQEGNSVTTGVKAFYEAMGFALTEEGMASDFAGERLVVTVPNEALTAHRTE